MASNSFEPDAGRSVANSPRYSAARKARRATCGRPRKEMQPVLRPSTRLCARMLRRPTIDAAAVAARTNTYIRSVAVCLRYGRAEGHCGLESNSLGNTGGKVQLRPRMGPGNGMRVGVDRVVEVAGGGK